MTTDDDRRYEAPPAVPAPVPRSHAALETLVLATVAIAIGVATDRARPWLALAPLLVALRYGAALGVACAAAQIAALMVIARHAAVAAPAAEIILAWLVAAVVSGQFRDAWLRRLDRAERLAGDAAARLATLARTYHVVVASHDRLARAQPGSPSNLRDALEAFARDLLTSDAPALDARILELFRVHAAVRAASLHAVDPAARVGAALATLGPAAATTDDPVISEAARRGEVVSVRDLDAADDVLVAVPIVDMTGRVHAIVAVRDLPFVALHADTLTLLAVLGGRLGDAIARADDVRHATITGDPSGAFTAGVSRAIRDARRHRVPTALAVVDLVAGPGEHPPRVLGRCVAADRRVTDEAEVVLGAGGLVRVVVLLRLADAAGLDRYLARIDAFARNQASDVGPRCEIEVRGWSLAAGALPDDPTRLGPALARLLDRNPAEEAQRGIVA